MVFQSLQYIYSLSNTLLNTVKGSSYTTPDGKTIALDDKDSISKSKKEIRDACNVYLREFVPKSRAGLSKFKNQKNKSITFTAEEWFDFITTLGSLSGSSVTHLGSSARAGFVAESMILMALQAKLVRRTS